MRCEISGIGFKKQLNVPAGSSLSDLKEKLSDKNLNTFYKRGQVLPSDYKIQEGDSIVAVAKNQQIKLG
jgi:hypothetical protein